MLTSLLISIINYISAVREVLQMEPRIGSDTVNT